MGVAEPGGYLPDDKRDVVWLYGAFASKHLAQRGRKVCALDTHADYVVSTVDLAEVEQVGDVWVPDLSRARRLAPECFIEGRVWLHVPPNNCDRDWPIQFGVATPVALYPVLPPDEVGDLIRAEFMTHQIV
jgi:hypothetical protein